MSSGGVEVVGDSLDNTIYQRVFSIATVVPSIDAVVPCTYTIFMGDIY
jgi:hypothetical protein